MITLTDLAAAPVRLSFRYATIDADGVRWAHYAPWGGSSVRYRMQVSASQADALNGRAERMATPGQSAA